MSKGNGGTMNKTAGIIDRVTSDGYKEYVSKGNGERRTLQGYLSYLAGNDGTPQVVSEAQFNKLSAGKDILYRGYRHNPDESINDFKYGKAYDGIGGNGEGHYFSFDKLGGFSGNGKYVVAIPKSNFKIGDRDKLYTQFLKERDKAYNVTYTFDRMSKSKNPLDLEIKRKVYDDFGRWATMKGYDGCIATSIGYKEFIVFNRSKLIVKR